MKKIIIINGPNLNLLGNRETDIYGKTTLAEIETLSKNKAKELNIILNFYQSNSESEIIDLIHKAQTDFDGIIINPGAFTHYSYAIRDAISAIEIPTVEVHISDINKREEFRQVSVISPVCINQVSGLGKDSYLEGLKLLIKFVG